MTQPHDALVKRFLSRPELIHDELKAILPAELYAAMDWSSLALQPSESVNTQLDKLFTDLLFKARLEGGGAAYLWILVEHQSASDYFMALRLVIYSARIWEKWLAEKPAVGSKVPLIIPVVIGNDDAGWRAPLRLSELYGLSSALLACLAPHWLELGYLMDDLAVVPEAELEKRTQSPLLRLVLWALRGRGVPSPDRAVAWTREMDRLTQAANTRDDLRALLVYMVVAGRDDGEAFVQNLAQHNPTVAEENMNLLERTEEQGRQKGRQEGLRAGLLAALRGRWGEGAATLAQGYLQKANVTDLERWLGQVGTAPSVEDLFADNK